MVDSLGILEGGEAVEGIKGLCWYTILGAPWLKKLAHRVKMRSIIRARAYNPLGWRLSPYACRWATIVNGTKQYLQSREGQVLPEFEDRYGKKQRACWSLMERKNSGRW